MKEDYLAILAYNESKGLWLGTSPEEKIQSSNPLAYKAAKLLKKDEMQTLGYNAKKVDLAVILASNNSNELKLRKLLAATFKIGDGKPIEEIIEKLQSIYNSLGWIDIKTRKIRVAEAKDLKNFGWFDIHPCKIKFGADYVNGYTIVRANFAIRVAA